MARTTRGADQGGRVIDLDSARAARAEAAGEPVVVKFGGRSFELPAELPAEAGLALDRGDAEGGIRSLFGAEAAEFIGWASIKDIDALAEGIQRIYAVDAGE